MRRRLEFALPVKAATVPSSLDWLHEIKHDGYRMMVIRERDRVIINPAPQIRVRMRSAVPLIAA
jgi:ATP-dependent DNA ligase